MSMKSLYLGAAAAVVLAAPAFAASVTGTVNVQGHVTATCTVQPGGGATFGGVSDIIDLGELDGTDGKISSTLSGSTGGSPALGIIHDYRVMCNTGAPAVTLDATRMTTGAGTGPSGGYTDQVDYTAQLKIDLSPSGTSTFFKETKSGGTSGGTSPLASPVKADGTSNVHVSVYAVITDGGSNSSVLKSGGYGSTNSGGGGLITITISPS